MASGCRPRSARKAPMNGETTPNAANSVTYSARKRGRAPSLAGWGDGWSKVFPPSSWPGPHRHGPARPGHLSRHVRVAMAQTSRAMTEGAGHDDGTTSAAAISSQDTEDHRLIEDFRPLRHRPCMHDRLIGGLAVTNP